MKPNWSKEGFEKIKQAAMKGNETRARKYREKYYLNPNRCLNCNEIIQYEKRDNKFCNHTCSGIYNNSRRNLGRKEKQKVFCLSCNKEINSNSIYCSNKCQCNHKYYNYIDRWKNGLENGMSGPNSISTHIRHYLFKKYDNKCCKCGWSKVNETSGKIPLQINHINGIYTDNTEDNLELICPNCHSLTSTFMALNKGNGRKHRK